ncbi:Fc.00g038070.m01.CDS01 [Cosmosporella sp. VM-42]
MSFKNEKLLVYVPAPTPVAWLERVKARFPELTVVWAETPVDNGQLIAPDHLPAEVWDGVTMVCMYHVPKVELVPKARFFQLASAGSDFWHKYPKYLDPEVIFANASGCQPPQIAEWVIGTYLSHEHHFLVYADQQKEEYWRPRLEMDVEVSNGRRMGILGYGGIGRQCARIGQALGMEVYAYTLRERKTAESRKDTTYCVPGTGDSDGLIPAKWFSGSSKDDVNNFLAQDLDLLVVSLPLNDATRGLIGPEQFQIMSKKKAFLSNIARGSIVDTDALVDALNSGHIRGAALDVTEPEPLPKGHPLWKAPNVFITPHIAWQSSKYWDNLADLLFKNLEKLAGGRQVINPEVRR